MAANNAGRFVVLAPMTGLFITAASASGGGWGAGPLPSGCKLFLALSSPCVRDWAQRSGSALLLALLLCNRSEAAACSEDQLVSAWNALAVISSTLPMPLMTRYFGAALGSALAQLA